jgi:hypothetical protein
MQNYVNSYLKVSNQCTLLLRLCLQCVEHLMKRDLPRQLSRVAVVSLFRVRSHQVVPVASVVAVPLRMDSI